MTPANHNVSAEPNPDLPMPAAVNKKTFREWRSPRLGRANPERMNNPVWEWLVRSRVNAYHINQKLKGPSVFKAGPGWCFDRFGRTSTDLPDGRRVLIGGEHEDFYDPDFYIYNDVVVQHPDGYVDIFGYPKEIFPPTDSHSATLAGQRIIIIGCCGYPDLRLPGNTPVFALDISSFAITPVETTGKPPGWIYKHEAELTADDRAIVVRGGMVNSGENSQLLIRNSNDWRLDLVTGQWVQLTDRRWQQWGVRRQDGEAIHLWQIQIELMQARLREAGMGKILDDQSDRMKIEFGVELPTMAAELGRAPDLKVAAAIFQPPISFQPMPPSEDDFSTHGIETDGVMIRYEQGMGGIQVTFEGDLPQATIDAVISDLRDKLAQLENHPCVAERLDNFA